ncbi:MAG: substrate-binding domain-containing protein, partial [Betaproteobacteria bacterium]
LHLVALRLLAALQAVLDDRADLARAGAPVLRLGVVDALLTAPATRSAGGLARALAACVDALPGLSLQLVTLRPIEIERRILAGELDAGILAAHPPAAGLQHRRLYAEPNSLFVAPGHPWFERVDATIALADLDDVACVVDPFSIDLPAHVQAAALRGGARADSIEGAALLALSGRFAAFLPDHLVAATQPLSALRRVHPALFSYEQDIVLSNRSGNVDAALRLLLRELEDAGG